MDQIKEPKCFYYEIKEALKTVLDNDCPAIIIQYIKSDVVNIDLANAAWVLFFGSNKKYWSQRDQGLIKTNLLDDIAVQNSHVLFQNLFILQHVCFINATDIQFIINKKSRPKPIIVNLQSRTDRFYTIYALIYGNLPIHLMTMGIGENTFSLLGYKMENGRCITVISVIC